MDLLADSTVNERLGDLGWDRDGNKIKKSVKKKDFKQALDLVNRVGDEAEAANHHPDIDIRYNVVTFWLWTHSAGGITQNDLDLAAKINSLT